MGVGERFALAPLFGWITHPALLAAGAALTLVPLAIHWWSRRRVRTVEWAAMRLLGGAMRREERRVRIEDRLLLALRMLGVLLLGVLVARPLSSSYWMGDDDRGVEYVVLIDDSLSMQTIDSEGTAFDRARRLLKELVMDRSDVGRDWLTLLVASDPRNPLLDRVPLAEQRLNDVAAAVDRLVASDASVDWGAALGEFRQWLATRSSSPRRVFICSDFRLHDWAPEDADNAPWDVGTDASTSAGERGGVNVTEGWLLCDVGAEQTANLQIVNVEPDGIVAAGVSVTYLVTLRNNGAVDAANVEVRLVAAETTPQQAVVESLPAGASTTVAFPLIFTSTIDREPIEPVEVRTEIVSNAPDRENRLLADDVASDLLWPGPGVDVVIVEASISGDSASQAPDYLRRALAPSVDAPSGFRVRTVTADHLESTRLDEVRVIFVGNVRALGPSVLELLANWVARGGGLVLAPGERTDATAWNARLFADGHGLAPLSLVDIQGTTERTSWSEWRDVDPDFSPARILSGDDNPFVARVKVFRWWGTSAIARSPTAEPTRGMVSSSTTHVRARLSDSAGSSLVVEKAFGDGRVVMLALPLDATWSDWPSDPSYVVFLQELTRDLATDPRMPQRVFAGQPIRCRVDMARYQQQAWLRTPAKQRWALHGESVEAAVPSGSGAEAKSLDWRFESPRTRVTGRHVLELNTADGKRHERSVAVLAVPREGELQRVPETWGARGELRGARRISSDVSWADAHAPSRELWWWAVWSVAGVLAVEQWLAWSMGKRR